jgi:hypothetical protein
LFLDLTLATYLVPPAINANFIILQTSSLDISYKGVLDAYGSSEDIVIIDQTVFRMDNSNSSHSA